LYFLFCGLSLQIIFPFAHWVLDSLWVAKFPVFLFTISCQMYRTKYFLPFCRLSLQSSDCFLYCSELVSLMRSYLSIVSLSCWATGVLFKKLLPMPSCFSVFPFFHLVYNHSFSDHLLVFLKLWDISPGCLCQVSSFLMWALG
jgi:hypothetical protein